MLTLAGALLSGCGAGAPPTVDTAAPSSAPVTAAPAPAHLTPQSIRISSIGVTAAVGPLGFNEAEQTVEVPTNPMDAGWYRFGPTPGEAGSAVILGHVDSTTGPAVFARLTELRRGDKVAVTMSDRSVVRYQVERVATYPNAKFPARRVYRPTGPATLTLVTCGGAYDSAAGGYQSNVVVYTSLLAPRAG